MHCTYNYVGRRYIVQNGSDDFFPTCMVFFTKLSANTCTPVLEILPTFLQTCRNVCSFLSIIGVYFLSAQLILSLTKVFRTGLHREQLKKKVRMAC